MSNPKFWIPPAARSRDETAYNCLTCGSSGVDQAHIISCSAAHADVEQQMVRDDSVWNGKPVVPDLEEWVAKHRTELLEGRKKL